MVRLMDKIYPAILAEMDIHNIEDTTQNRIMFLQGIYDVWREDENPSFEQLSYMYALHSELFRLRLKLRFPRVLGLDLFA